MNGGVLCGRPHGCTCRQGHLIAVAVSGGGILMSQNRQAKRDRIAAALDYEVTGSIGWIVLKNSRLRR